MSETLFDYIWTWIPCGHQVEVAALGIRRARGQWLTELDLYAVKRKGRYALAWLDTDRTFWSPLERPGTITARGWTGKGIAETCAGQWTTREKAEAAALAAR